MPCGNYFSRSFSSSARSFAISSGMPMCCGHTGALAAGAAGGRAGGGGDIPASSKKRPVLFAAAQRLYA